MANIALMKPNSYPCFTRQLPLSIFLYTLVDVLIWGNVFLVFVNIKWPLSASGNVPLTPLASDSDLFAASRLSQAPVDDLRCAVPVGHHEEYSILVSLYDRMRTMMFDTIFALVGELAVSAFDSKIRWSCKRLRIVGYDEDCYQ